MEIHINAEKRAKYQIKIKSHVVTQMIQIHFAKPLQLIFAHPPVSLQDISSSPTAPKLMHKLVEFLYLHQQRLLL
jgi:hypothetical protein